MISILIILRNDSLRQFVGQTLERHTDFDVTGIYESPEVFLAEPASPQSPQVVLLDNNLQVTGLQTLKKLKRRLSASEFVLFTFSNKSDDIYNAFCAGASGYILQSDDVEDMIISIQDIIRGDMIVLPSIAQKILDWHFISNEYKLTVGEVQLMRAFVEGHAIPYIQGTLKVPTKLMRSQIKSIFRKLHNSTQPTTASN